MGTSPNRQRNNPWANANARPVNGTAAEDVTVTPVGDTGAERGSWRGHSKTSLARWLGANGYTVDQALALFTALGLRITSKRLSEDWGRGARFAKRGEADRLPPELPPDDVIELRRLLASTSAKASPSKGPAVAVKTADEGTNQLPTHARPRFVVGRIYDRRRDIHGPYGGQQQGGICTPRDHPFVFLFTGPGGEQHGYRDGWDENGVFLYTDEGQVGPMEFVRGNLAIRDHAENGRDLLLFESLGKGEGYRFVGWFTCGGWEYRDAPDREGRTRQAVVFHLFPDDRPVPEPAEAEEPAPAAVSLDELRRRAVDACKPAGGVNARESLTRYYERSAAVRRYVLRRADGTCESCRVAAPFPRPDGSPYLESHHTRRVSDGGPDHPRYVAGVCPTCHARIHHGQDGPAVNRRLQEYLDQLEGSE